MTTMTWTRHENREDPREPAPPFNVNGRRKSSTAEPGKIQLHTIIFFPVDYDDPHNMSITQVGMADNSLSTKPHTDMHREPPLAPNDKRSFTDEELPGYFRDPHFQRVQTRLRSIYFTPRHPTRTTHWDEESDTYAAIGQGKPQKKGARDEEPQKFLHQMPVFMDMLREKNFRTIYARNLQSALRHARRLKNRLDPTTPLPYKDPRTLQTPRTAGSDTLSEGLWTARDPPEQKVMLLTYRAVGSRIHMDSRAYDAHIDESVLLYPSREEVALDSAKVPDLRAFDVVAKKYDQWRPHWHRCDLSGRTPCDFEARGLRDVYDGKTQILKRSHSSCTRHLLTVEWRLPYTEPACYGALHDFNKDLKEEDVENVKAPATTGRLKAVEERVERQRPGVLPKRMENYALHNSHFFNYVHQEYVESLQKWGELRVFVAMRYDADGTNGKPEVVDIILTHFNTEPDADKVDEAIRQDNDPESAKGYGKDYRRKSQTKPILQGYCRARGLPVNGLKKDLQNRLVAHDAQRAQEPESASEASEFGAPEPDGDDEHELDGATLVGGGGGDADAGPATQPDEIPLIRCKYSSHNMNVTRLNLASTQGFTEYPRVTIPAIKRFALAQYLRLHKRFPTQFESLNVGARLDIGVGPKQVLFLNEVTRWWFASWFGGFEDVGRQDVVARAFAESFAHVYRVDPPGEGEGDEESADDEDDFDEDGFEDSAVLYKVKKGGTEGKRPRVGRVVGDGGGDDGGGNGGDEADGDDGDGDGGGAGGGRGGRGGGSNRGGRKTGGGGAKGKGKRKGKKKHTPTPAIDDDGDQNNKANPQDTPVPDVEDEARDEGVEQEPKQLRRTPRTRKKRLSVDNDDNEEKPPRKKGRKK
ncbi:hypothetical protein P171DRAFT_209673 [Karstenula rhodostoma CBS 690.94]|uniref:SAP domain-containing protein n=1 Tax=Karstenula rhodostoma CBS 690.94 TaxID=1392251 RepID=A0A9P4PS60_9PLEO|nr:hypothetical protein P171DRAFT_209673 [Karstenula rhodostoma CBS 690.94]